MAISRPDGAGDISNQGMTLSEAAQPLLRSSGTLPPNCRSCGGTCHAKDWQPHPVATLLGEVRLKRPRFLCAGCGCGESGVSWPSHCRSTLGAEPNASMAARTDTVSGRN
jgi:hypothetical protein